jgi:hypothetical protein
LPRDAIVAVNVVVDREAVPPDFQTLASEWLEGCELP